MPRMKILNALEVDSFESPPVFTTAERKRYFTVPLGLVEILDTLRTPANKICFSLMAGYFRARHKFFGKQFRRLDVEFVARRLNIALETINLELYDKQTAARHQQLLIEYFGFQPFDESVASLVKNEIAAQIRRQLRPKLILFETIALLERRKIEIPSYNLLANLIIAETNHYKRELVRLVEKGLSKNHREMLDALLEKDVQNEQVSNNEVDGETNTASSKVQRYRLTLLKKPRQSTRPSKIKANLADLELLRGLYLEFEPAISALGLTHEGLRYYASSVIKAEIFQIARRSPEDRYLHLLSFIAHQTFRLQDLLIDTLLQAVQSATNAVTREHREQYYIERTARNDRLKTLLTGLDKHLLKAFAQINAILIDDNLADGEKLARIAALVEANEPNRQSVADNLAKLKRETTTAEQERDYYEMLGRRSLKLQNRVSDIVRLSIFDAVSSASPLIDAILYFQQRRGEVDKRAPLDFLAVKEQDAVWTDGEKFQVSLYKALLFIAIADAIKAGKLNFIYSHKYRSLDDYLLPAEEWEKRRTALLEETNLARFEKCEALLASLSETLDRQYHRTNRRLRAGKNPLLKFRRDGSFHVATPKEDDDEDALPLSRFFPERKYVSLLEILSTVNRAAGFLEEFEHWQLKYQKRRPFEKTFFAGLIGYGCDVGLGKIARISKQINESELENTINWYFSLENIHAANDRILSLLDKLELPNVYRRKKDKLHTSSDGQKFEVAVESLNANYSFKYFGQSKGVSVYTFIDERHLLFHSTVISSAEREAAYVIDGLMHNEVVKSDIHSSDTHGYSEIIFGVSFLLGFTFAPRIKNFGKQRLYGFEKRKSYEELDYEILPAGYIDTEIIAENWDLILRFIATIKLKHTTASQLFRRLNSYSKQHPLYRALKEFGKIPKSDFLLCYTDDPALRQAIEKQLNKVESAQKFSRAVSFGHNQEFVQSEKDEQEIAESCRRLIKNAIICWNYLYLTQLLQKTTNQERREEILSAIKNGSVVTWQHINLHGEYDFSDEKLQDSVGLDLPTILGEKVIAKWEAEKEVKVKIKTA